jgi:hypothetical protein
MIAYVHFVKRGKTYLQSLSLLWAFCFVAPPRSQETTNTNIFFRAMLSHIKI